MREVRRPATASHGWPSCLVLQGASGVLVEGVLGSWGPVGLVRVGGFHELS